MQDKLDNEAIKILLQHRSIRKFKPEPVKEEQLETIVRCAQMASSSSNMQAYSIIRVRDKERRSRIRAVTGQQFYVEEAPEFLVFCADLKRLEEASALQGVPFVSDGLEPFLVASVDAALAAQNAAAAAEAMGLGVCYIGSIRNDPAEVTRVLELPRLVYPVFGLCIGYPDQEPTLRPRLPLTAVLHTDTYKSEPYGEELREYDVRMGAYYRERTGGKKETAWTEEIAAKMSQPQRVHLKDFIKVQGFDI